MYTLFLIYNNHHRHDDKQYTEAMKAHTYNSDKVQISYFTDLQKQLKERLENIKKYWCYSTLLKTFYCNVPLKMGS